MWAAIILALCAITLVAQTAYNNWRVTTGPSGWYALEEGQTGGGRGGRAYETILGGPFSSQAACLKSLDKTPAFGINGYRRMLARNAGKINGYYYP